MLGRENSPHSTAVVIDSANTTWRYPPVPTHTAATNLFLCFQAVGSYTLLDDALLDGLKPRPPDPLVLTPPPPPGTKHAREQRQRCHGFDERSSSRISPLPRATCRPRKPFAVIVSVVIAAGGRICRPQSRRPPSRAACTAFGSSSIGSSRTRAEAAHVLRDDHRAGHRRRLVLGLMLPVGFLWGSGEPLLGHRVFRKVSPDICCVLGR